MSRIDFRDHLAEVMPEMRRMCADQLRLEAKVFGFVLVHQQLIFSVVPKISSEFS